MIVTLGSQGLLNQWYSSGIGDETAWTPGPSNVSYIQVLEQAGPLITQASARGRELIFSPNDVYQAQYVGPPVFWIISKLFSTDGIIGPKAIDKIEDAVFWMGQGDWYVFDGFQVNVVRNNTVKRYVYDNINWAATYKCFTFANVSFNEIWWFYPAGQDTECNNYVIYNFKEGHWTIGTLPRTAAEEPTNVSNAPLLIQSQINSTFIVPNSLSSFFFDLADNPIATTMGSPHIKHIRGF